MSERKVKHLSVEISFEGEIANRLANYAMNRQVTRALAARELIVLGMKELGLLPKEYDYQDEVRRNKIEVVKKIRQPKVVKEVDSYLESWPIPKMWGQP